MNETDKPLSMNFAQTMAFTGFGEWTLRRMVYAEEIGFSRIKGKLYFLRTELEDLINKNYVKAEK
ncbi:MAG: helix-turn-helix domain-containing protein [Candidatus Yanofskybacteria bacterium]|nr:helix-turn-helix domain-containing protein [Candidatus Yanofskybacteria bacterium]